MKRGPMLAIGLVVAAVYLASASAFVVNETDRVLVVRLGKPVGVVDAPGLHFKAPLIDTATAFERRLLPLEPPSEQIILGDQKRIDAATYARFRIADPLMFYQTVGSVEQGRARIAQIVSSALRRELGQAKLLDLLTVERERIIEAIRSQVVERSRSLGVEVVEVRLLRADLPAETSQAIYDRMKSERDREAKELRAQGFQWAQEIQSRADRQKTVIVAEAQQRAKVTRGEADAEAARILGDAHQKSPAFYAFVRTLQTYRQTLAGASPTLLLSPDMAFLNQFAGGPDAAVAAARATVPAPGPAKQASGAPAVP